MIHSHLAHQVLDRLEVHVIVHPAFRLFRRDDRHLAIRSIGSCETILSQGRARMHPLRRR